MLLFLLQFFLSNIFFSLVIFTALMRLNKGKIHSNFELFLYSLGTGPAFTTLVLYYLLLFLPGCSYLFYFGAILIVYAGILYYGRKCFPDLKMLFALKGENKLTILKNLNISSRKNRLLNFIVVFLIILYFTVLFPFIVKMPISGTDALKYGNLGKIFFAEKSLEYRWILPNPKTGYYFNTLHAPSFSLLLTWEKIMDSFFGIDKDLYYKSNSPYYLFLILLLLIYWIYPKNKFLALFSIFIFCSGYSVFSNLVSHHLDFFRLFFLTISWIFLAYSIKKKDSLSFFLLGAFSGLASFIHSIGAVLAIVNCITLFIFLPGKLTWRLKKVLYVFVLIIFFGWTFYILDIVWGFGWFIFNHRITFWG